MLLLPPPRLLRRPRLLQLPRLLSPLLLLARSPLTAHAVVLLDSLAPAHPLVTAAPSTAGAEAPPITAPRAATPLSVLALARERLLLNRPPPLPPRLRLPRPRRHLLTDPAPAPLASHALVPPSEPAALSTVGVEAPLLIAVLAARALSAPATKEADEKMIHLNTFKVILSREATICMFTSILEEVV